MALKTPTFIAVAFLMLVCLSLSVSNPEKEKIYVGIVFPEANYRKRWNTFFRFVSQMEPNKFSSNGLLLVKYYDIDRVRGMKVQKLRDHFNPRDALYMFCNNMLTGKESVSVLLYIGQFRQNIENSAQQQYILQFANYIGLPVISWTGYKANSFQVNDQLPFIISIQLYLMKAQDKFLTGPIYA